MKLVRKTATTLGAIFLAALLLAALAPKATRGIAAALVQVTNTTANPVPMVSADNPANFPFVAEICGSEPGICSSTTSDSFTVPLMTTTGIPVKRLVIEDVTIHCDGDTGPGALLAELVVPGPADGNASIVSYDFALTAADNNALGHASVRMYVDPGATVTQQLVAGNDFCQFILTGHLEKK